MGKVLPGRLRYAVVLALLTGLAGCQDKAAEAPAKPDAPRGNGPAKAAAVGEGLTGEALARARTCLACHQVDRKQVGPAYQDVATRFAGNPEAMTILSNAIRKGGRGQWGAVPMPAQPQVSEAEAAELARWILSLKP